METSGQEGILRIQVPFSIQDFIGIKNRLESFTECLKKIYPRIEKAHFNEWFILEDVNRILQEALLMQMRSIQKIITPPGTEAIPFPNPNWEYDSENVK